MEIPIGMERRITLNQEVIHNLGSYSKQTVEMDGGNATKSPNCIAISFKNHALTGINSEDTPPVTGGKN